MKKIPSPNVPTRTFVGTTDYSGLSIGRRTTSRGIIAAKPMRKYFGYLAIIFGLLIFSLAIYLNSRVSQVPRPFSSNTLLDSSWQKYKIQFINSDGRVIDYANNSLTTSEGQSYAMLRAVWTDDKPGFDLVWKWTKENLQKRPNDKLFGWRWGQQHDQFGFLSGGGQNSATDADTDIALALVLANRRWWQQAYLDEAEEIITDIWKTETAVTAEGERYLIAGNWAQNQDKIVINPSYFAPYAWRLFAQVDNNDWLSLIAPAYELLEKTTDPPDDLPPDWISLNRHNGDVVTPEVSGLTQNYSFDAMRIPWRIYLDWLWNKDIQARDYLVNNFQKLFSEYQQNGRLPASFSHDGTVLDQTENPTMYATALGYFLLKDETMAKKIYETKILTLYSNDTNSFLSTLPYYDQNWLWFGTGLYNGYLIPF